MNTSLRSVIDSGGGGKMERMIVFIVVLAEKAYNYNLLITCIETVLQRGRELARANKKLILFLNIYAKSDSVC